MDTFGNQIDPFNLASESPLAADWSSYFQDQLPSTGWWNSQPVPYAYEQGWSNAPSYDYHPGGNGMMYEPVSSFGWQSIAGQLDAWHMKEFPELYDFSQSWQQGGVSGVGTVAKDPSFGQFYKTPEVYAEIQAAAQKYGVPANFLQAIIAKESSGDWASNSMVKHARGMRIHGYIGVFENAARSWGFDFNKGIGNRAYQIEMLAGGLRRFYDQLHGQNPQYGWLNVAAMHYSGDPDMNYTPGDSYQHGTTRQYVAETESWWKRLDQMAGNTWSNFTSTGQNTGIGTINSQQWAGVNQYDSMVMAAAQKYGVPANLVKAIMRLESNGNRNAVSPQGATGLMQVMPFHVGGNQSVLFDPQTNIDVGTRILMENYRRYGTWEMAAKAYIGLGGADALGTTSSTYWQRVNQYWNELNAGSSGMFGGQPAANGGTSTPLSGIWGNVPVHISQEHGRTGFSAANPRMYNYSYGVLGYLGHPGIDVAMPLNTPLYSPVSGTVITSGGSGSYFNTEGTRYQSGMGELRILLDNGHQVILGHTSRITVPANSRVTAGMPVGFSGYPGGPHLHLEYRIPNPSFSSQWEAVDPRKYITGGIIPGTHQAPYMGLGSAYQPMTYKNLLLAGAQGQTIPQGATFYGSGGGSNAWNSALRQLMAGQVPFQGSTNYTFTYNQGQSPLNPYTPGGPNE